MPRFQWRTSASDRELREAGFIRADDGVLLDNRDGFYEIHPDNFIRTYDCRTCVAVSRTELDRLRRIEKNSKQQEPTH